MRNFKRFLAMALTMLMVIGCVSLSAFAFEDYADGDFTAAVDNLASKGIIYGASETEFNPDAPVLRWQAALFLSRMASGLTSLQDQNKIWFTETNTTSFSDVEAYQYIGAIQYAANYNFVVGNGDGTFNPNGQIILQDMLTIIVRALGYDVDPITGDKFGTAGYPWKYISVAVKLGLDKGLENVAYTAPLTRAQTAQLLNNLFYALNVNETSYAIEVFDDYSAMGFNDTIIVLATEKSAMPDKSFAAAGKLTVASLHTDGTYGDAATINASDLGFEVVAGDSARVYTIDGKIKAAVKSTAVVSKLVCGYDGIKDANGDKLTTKQVLIGTDAVNVATDAANDGIVLFKSWAAYAKVTNLEAVVFDIGGNWGDTFYVRAYDDNGDGALDRGYVFKPSAATLKMYNADFNRKADGAHFFDFGGGVSKYVRNFVNFKTSASTTTLADGTYIGGFFDEITESFYYTEAVAPGTTTVTGVLTEINLATHTLTVSGKKYIVGTNYDGPFKYETVLAACKNLDASLLNMTIQLVISEDEDVVVAIETQESDGKAFVIYSAEKELDADKKETGRILAKAVAYKSTTMETIDVIAVDGVYGAVPAANTFYAGYKDFNGKWMLYSGDQAVMKLVGMAFGTTDKIDFTWGQKANTSGIHLSTVAYAALTADANTQFQIWNGDKAVTISGKPNYDALITGIDGANMQVVYEYEKEKVPEYLGTMTNVVNGVYEELDGDGDHDYFYRLVLKNVFVWGATFSGSYTDANGKVISTVASLDYDDIVIAQNFYTDNRRPMMVASVTTAADELAAVKAVLGGEVSRVYKWSNLYSIKTGTYVTVAEANVATLTVPTANANPKFYYVKNGVVVGECALGTEILDGAVVASSEESSTVVAMVNGAAKVITMDGPVSGITYMNWYGAISIDLSNNNPVVTTNAVTIWNGTNYTAASIAGYRNNTYKDTMGITACYIYSGSLTSSPVIIFHDAANGLAD